MYEIAQERIGAMISHSSNMIPTNSLSVMYVPTSGGMSAGRSPVSCQSHTRPNSTMARSTVVDRSVYPANFHHWFPLYSFHAMILPTRNRKQKAAGNKMGRSIK